MSKKDQFDDDIEFSAMRQVHDALAPLDAAARKRVLIYVSQRLDIAEVETNSRERIDHSPEALGQMDSISNNSDTGGDELDGISPVAVKWIRRNGWDIDSISKVYSLGIDDIDLVANTIPGNSKRERTKNVFRLIAISGYLESGAARTSHEKLKEACLHYDAFDARNHSTNLKSLGGEISGTKESGYTLTAKGITAATELIKQIVNAGK